MSDSSKAAPETPAAKAVRELKILFWQVNSPSHEQHHTRDAVLDELLAATRADELNRLARSIPPMTKSIVRTDPSVRCGDPIALWDEVDALSAALAATREMYSVDEAEQERLRASVAAERDRARLAAQIIVEEIGAGGHGPSNIEDLAPRITAALRAEREEHAEETALRERLATLLRETANAIKGSPPPLTLWDWSDLPALGALHAHLRLSTEKFLRLNDIPVASPDETAAWADARDTMRTMLRSVLSAMDRK